MPFLKMSYQDVYFVHGLYLALSQNLINRSICPFFIVLLYDSSKDKEKYFTSSTLSRSKFLTYCAIPNVMLYESLVLPREKDCVI